MITLSQDPSARAERNHKNQIYKNILDQQIRSKRQHSLLAQQHLSQYSSPQQPTSYQRYYKSIPPLPSCVRGSYPQINSNYHRYLPTTRNNTQEDDTQKYLKACQDIIKNLRQLKEKRIEKQLAPLNLEHTPEIKQIHKKEHHIQNPKEFYYVPKNKYFSNMFYQKYSPNKAQSNKQVKKGNHKPFKTMQNSQCSVSRDNPQKIKKSVRITHAITKDKASKPKIFPTVQPQLIKQNQSLHPEGLKQNLSSKRKSSKSKQSKTHSKSQQKHKKSGVKKKHMQREYFKNQEGLKNQNQMKKLKKQLSECLIELTRYLKAKKQQPKEQKQRKQQQVNEEVQTVSAQLKIQQNENPKQRDKQYSIKELKNEALIKLRNINNKSKVLLMKIERKKSQIASKMNPYKTEAQSQRSELSQQIPQEDNSNIQPSSQSQTPIKGIGLQESRRNSQLSLDQRESHSLHKDNSELHKYQELVKALMHHLNHQQQQNEDLAQCLKQLSEYLKYQNEQIQLLKNSRLSSLSDNKNKDKSRVIQPFKQEGKQVRFQQFPKSISSKIRPTSLIDYQQQANQQQQVQKQNEIKLKQAFLKRLKKARARGSMLNEKIYSYKKHHDEHLASQQSKIQNIKPQYPRTTINPTQQTY